MTSDNGATPATVTLQLWARCCEDELRHRAAELGLLVVCLDGQQRIAATVGQVSLTSPVTPEPDDLLAEWGGPPIDVRRADIAKTVLSWPAIDNGSLAADVDRQHVARVLGSLLKLELLTPEAWAVLEDAGKLPEPPVPPEQTKKLRRRKAKVCPAEGYGTELWFARSLVDKHGHDLRHVGKWKHWLAYDEDRGRWSQDDTGEVMRRAKAVAGALLVDAQAAQARALTSGDRSALERAEERLKVAKRYYQVRALENGIRLASTEEPCAAAHDVWDRDPMRLSVANGVIDLQTGRLRKARREDYITLGSPVVHDARAAAPTFVRFLARVLPDEDVRAYLQRFLGFCLTGRTDEHTLHFLHGGGANGKSTLLDVLRHVLGDYGAPAPPSLLMRRRGQEHPTELAALFGRRLVFASETPEGGRLDEERVKALTGGDAICARRMGENYWSFDPTHKLLIATNHKPRIVGTDQGLWRRVRLVPFTVEIPEAQRDGQLPTKLRAEAAGVLRWLVEGCLMWQAEGLAPPTAVMAATNDYRREEDELGAFIVDALIMADGQFVTTAAIYAEYETWCEEQGIKVRERVGRRTLTRKLGDRGFEYVNKPRRGFRGLILRSHTNA